jgi:hypothetical protein
MPPAVAASGTIPAGKIRMIAIKTMSCPVLSLNQLSIFCHIVEFYFDF